MDGRKGDARGRLQMPEERGDLDPWSSMRRTRKLPSLPISVCYVDPRMKVILRARPAMKADV
jgi:hypothetical protein